MKDKCIILGFCFILCFFFIYSLLDSDILVSRSERRNLATLPEFQISSLTTGEYLKDLDKYVIDQFPFRDTFRQAKIFFLQGFYRKKLSHDAYLLRDGIYQLDFSVNKKSIQYFTKKLTSVSQQYFKNKKVFYAIIPDKNYYVEDSILPKMDYELLYTMVDSQLPPTFEKIDLRTGLDLDSYYHTDLHWKQEKLEQVVKILQSKLDLANTVFPKRKSFYYPFYGAYYSKGAKMVDADTIEYLTSNVIESTEVYNYEKNRFESVYQKENLQNVDAYDIYLSGATPLLILENSLSSSNRELILFRDSFASSLAPLLLDNYKKITLIDLRYLSSKLLGTISEIDFTEENQDILFLYSVPIVNQSFSLK